MTLPVGGVERRLSVAAGASATHKSISSENQDVVRCFTGRGFAACVVGDGVGSLPDSGRVARVAADSAIRTLGALGPDAIAEAFEAAALAAEHVSLCGEGESDGDEPVHGATTLLIGVLHDGMFQIGYVGNGALLIVRHASGVNSGPGSYHWSNYLIPDIGFEDGREVLTRYYGPGVHCGGTPLPTFIRLDATTPTVLMLVTDGIWSEEQYPLGSTSDGMRWAQRPPILTQTLDFAARLMTECAASSSDRSLDDLLQVHLDSLRDAGLLEDDATIGLLMNSQVKG